MTEDDVRRIIREEIAAAAPKIVEATLAKQRLASRGNRLLGMGDDCRRLSSVNE